MFPYLELLQTDEERDQFTELYRTYRNEMLCVAKAILHNQHDAEDVVHESFSYILKNFKKISDIKCPKTRSYVAIVVENKAKDLLRKRKRHTEVPLDDSLENAVTTTFDDKIVTSITLAGALESLPKRYQDALLLRYDNGCSTEEIAEIMNVTTDTALRLISRARKALEKAYEKGNLR